jgi:hypothetical protein
MHFGWPGIIAKLLMLGMLWGDGAFICQIGGPAYRIGMGGGAASSMVSLLYTLSRMVFKKRGQGKLKKHAYDLCSSDHPCVIGCFRRFRLSF